MRHIPPSDVYRWGDSVFHPWSFHGCLLFISHRSRPRRASNHHFLICLFPSFSMLCNKCQPPTFFICIHILDIILVFISVFMKLKLTVMVRVFMCRDIFFFKSKSLFEIWEDLRKILNLKKEIWQIN